jgi:hypothetical protein
MKRLTGPTPIVTDQRDALDVLEGYPKPPERTGSAADALVPPEYYEGAFGWTAHACHFVELMDQQTAELTGEALLDVPDEMAAAHQGKEVMLTDGRTVIVDLSAAEDIPN